MNSLHPACECCYSFAAGLKLMVRTGIGSVQTSQPIVTANVLSRPCARFWQTASSLTRLLCNSNNCIALDACMPSSCVVGSLVSTRFLPCKCCNVPERMEQKLRRLQVSKALAT
jgi:hypothetical protein